MGACIEPKVYVLFAAYIPPGWEEPPRRAARAQVTGLGPRLHVPLAIGLGWSRTPSAAIVRRCTVTSTYPVGQERCAAVKRQAAALPREYAAKAVATDRSYRGTEPSQVGPVESKLRTYDAVRALVFGAWGEAS